MKQEVISSSKVSSGYVWVSTCLTPDHGWETMVFPCDATGEVSDWLELDAERYSGRGEAEEGHGEVISRWQAG